LVPAPFAARSVCVVSSHGKVPAMDCCEEDSDNERIQDADHFKEYHGGCTDIPCCCIWLTCLLALSGVIGYGFKHGNPRRLHHGIDHANRVCGVDLGVELLPYTYFCPPNSYAKGGALTSGLEGLANQMMSNPVCVAACPQDVLVANATVLGGVATVPVLTPPQVNECAQGPKDVSNPQIAAWSVFAYKTTPKMNYCFPDAAVHLKAANEVAQGLAGFVPTLMKAADSLSKGWPIYITIFVLSVFMGYAYICCLKACAKPAIWLAMAISFVAFTGSAIYLINEAPTIGTNAVMQENFGQFATSMAYATGTVCAVAAFAILCLVCCCASQIGTAVIAIEMTTDVMACIPSLLFAPIVKAIVKMNVAMFLLVGFVYCLSTAQPKSVGGSAMLRTFDYKQEEKFMMFFYAFMFFWIMSFITALYQFAVAYATADYYYASATSGDGDRDVHCCNVAEGLCVGLAHHQGSFALGSFVIACFSMVQRIIEYINKSNPGNPVVKVVTCCCWVCVTICKSCAEFINKNAYIGIAVKGYNFCQGALKAFEVMVKNAPSMAILNGATFVFQVAGVLLITAASIVIADGMTNLPHFTDPAGKWFLPNPILVVVVCGLIGFSIAKIFMDVFDMVADTLMYCLATDGWRSGRCPGPVTNAMAEANGQGKQALQQGQGQYY